MMDESPIMKEFELGIVRVLAEAGSMRARGMLNYCGRDVQGVYFSTAGEDAAVGRVVVAWVLGLLSQSFCEFIEGAFEELGIQSKYLVKIEPGVLSDMDDVLKYKRLYQYISLDEEYISNSRIRMLGSHISHGTFNANEIRDLFNEYPEECFGLLQFGEDVERYLDEVIPNILFHVTYERFGKILFAVKRIKDSFSLEHGLTDDNEAEGFRARSNED